MYKITLLCDNPNAECLEWIHKRYIILQGDTIVDKIEKESSQFLPIYLSPKYYREEEE